MTVEATDAPSTADADPIAPAQASWRRWLHPKHPWLVALGVIVVVLLVAEGVVRLVEPQLPTQRAGDAAEMIVKARQIDALRADGDDQVDVVVFGTSMMDTSFSPSTMLARSERFDSVYNASVVGAPLATQLRWADEVVLDRLDPDLIVLGVHPVDLLLNDVLNLNIRPAQSDVIFARVLRETSDSPIAAADRFLYDNVALVRQRGPLRQPRIMWDATLRAAQGEDKPGELALRDEAYWYQHLTPLGESSQFLGDPFNITAMKEQLRENLQLEAMGTTHLHALLERATESDAQVVVLVPPVPLRAWRDVGIDIGALDAGVALIGEIAGEYGVPVLDFSDAAYPNEQFADLLHSNDRGAIRFTTDVTARLDQLGLGG